MQPRPWLLRSCQRPLSLQTRGEEAPWTARAGAYEVGHLLTNLQRGATIVTRNDNQPQRCSSTVVDNRRRHLWLCRAGGFRTRASQLGGQGSL